MFNSEITKAESPAILSPIVDQNSKFYHLFRFIQRAYGNDIGKLLTSLNSFMALGLTSRYVKNKKLKLALNAARYGIPAFLYGSELVLQFKNYIREIKSEKSPTHQKWSAKLCRILGIKENNQSYLKLQSIPSSVGGEVITWLLTKPDTKDIRVLSFYNVENCQEVDKLCFNGDGEQEIAILFEYHGQKLLLLVGFKIWNDVSFVNRSEFVTTVPTIIALKNERENIRIAIESLELELREVFLCEFIRSLNTEKNILCFQGMSTIRCEPRIKIEENINQFPVDDFIKEIKQVLDCGRKRAYAFVSRPGTGKSTILRKIEEVMKDYVFFKLSPNDFDSGDKIRERFTIAKKIHKSVVLIEDLDSCGLHEKNSKAGIFLDEIDDVNNDLNMVILVTINDTSRVHFSIINRPGRFDKVIEIKPPRSEGEVYEVIISKAQKLKKKYCPNDLFFIPPMDDIDQNCLKECLSREFTQAEITNAITEQIFISLSIMVSENKLEWSEVTTTLFNELFISSIESHKKTQQAIKNCNFNNNAPLTDLSSNDMIQEGKCGRGPAVTTFESI